MSKIIINNACHNPYFNRWFSAMSSEVIYMCNVWKVTILILIDGFLQLNMKFFKYIDKYVTILILIDGFLQ